MGGDLSATPKESERTFSDRAIRLIRRTGNPGIKENPAAERGSDGTLRMHVVGGNLLPAP